MTLHRFLRVVLSGMLGLTLLQLTPLGFLSAVQAQPDPKVTICHFPPGNPANYQTITVGASAVAAHVANHGDLIGDCATVCDDKNACTTDSLDPRNPGKCINTPISCNDGNACTVDSCNPASGCVNTTKSCNDGNACTDDSCNPATGCVNTTKNCNDGNACTDDSCNPANGCVNTQKTCNDGNACTTDSCNPASGCVYTGKTCNDGNACTDDSCNPASGCINTPKDCKDNDACTLDRCRPDIGCYYDLTICPAPYTCDPDTGLCVDENGCNQIACQQCLVDCLAKYPQPGPNQDGCRAACHTDNDCVPQDMTAPFYYIECVLHKKK